MKFVPVWIHSGYGRPVKSHFCSCGFLENRWRKTVENKKFPNRCQKMNTNLEKLNEFLKMCFRAFTDFSKQNMHLVWTRKPVFLSCSSANSIVFAHFWCVASHIDSTTILKIWWKCAIYFPVKSSKLLFWLGINPPFFSSFWHSPNQFFKIRYEFRYQNLLCLIFVVDSEYVLRKN